MKKTNIQAELALIDAADISELKDMFRAEFGFDIQISNAETIKRRLQYRVQENICGGLTDAEIATLDRAYRSLSEAYSASFKVLTKSLRLGYRFFFNSSTIRNSLCIWLFDTLIINHLIARLSHCRNLS